MPAQKHLRLKVKLIHLQIARSEKNKTCEITNSLFWRNKDEGISIQSNPKAKVGILMKMHLRKESGCSVGLKARPGYQSLPCIGRDAQRKFVTVCSSWKSMNPRSNCLWLLPSWHEEKSFTITAHQTAGASALEEAASWGCWCTSHLNEFWINVLSCSWCSGRKILTSNLLRGCYKCCPLLCSPWWTLYIFFFVEQGMHRAVDGVHLAHQHLGDASELNLGHFTDASTGVE